MTEAPDATKPSSLTPLLALPTAIVGLFATDFFPLIGTALGILAVVAAVLVFIRLPARRWVAWLLAGFAIGTLILWALALNNMHNPGAPSGSGSGIATPLR